jgi:hypothetical protein
MSERTSQAPKKSDQQPKPAVTPQAAPQQQPDNADVGSIISDKTLSSGTPPPHTQQHILHMQRTYGNRATQQHLAQTAQPTNKGSLPPIRGIKSTQPSAFSTPTATENPASIAETSEQTTLTVAAASNTPQPPVQRNFISDGFNALKNKVTEGADALKKKAFETALSIAGVPKNAVMGLLGRAGDAIKTIFADPVGFVRNLISGIKQGFTQFVGNIGTHLKAGFTKWLFGAMAEAGIEIPKEFNLQGIFSVVAQVIGLTLNNLKARVVKFIGEKNAKRIEAAWGMMTKFTSGGIGGLWEMLKDYLTNLKETVIDGIKEWVIGQIIKNAVLKIISLFNPASGLVSVIQTIYNVIKFFIERAAQIKELFSAITGAISAIAQGSVEVVASKIEQVLAKAIPVVIGFLASFLGLGGITNKIREIIKKVQDKVNTAIDTVIRKIANSVKSLFGKGSKEDVKQATKPDKELKAKEKAGLQAIDDEEKQYMTDEGMERTEAEQVAMKVKKQHPVFASITVVDGGDTWDYDYQLVQRTKKKGEEKSKRKTYLGATPSKNSRTGLEVQERMRREGKLKTIDGELMVYFDAPGEKRKWWSLSDCDMAHRRDAVKYWNKSGFKHGAKSEQIRLWMLDPNNYELQPYWHNRSEGAKLGIGYRDPE